MKAHKLAPVFLAAPTSTEQRLRDVGKHSRGFVYAISRTGITGTRQELAGDARSLVERLRAHTKLPDRGRLWRLDARAVRRGRHVRGRGGDWERDRAEDRTKSGT